MSTRAIQFLKQKKITFEVVSYTHAEKGAEFAAKAIGYPLEMTVKTLVVEVGDKQYVLVLMPGDQQLSLKRLANVLGRKRTTMADTNTAERITGYLVGGISPFGTKKDLKVIMEEHITKYDKVLINAGQRGKMILMSPGDIQKTLGCRVASLMRS